MKKLSQNGKAYLVALVLGTFFVCLNIYLANNYDAIVQKYTTHAEEVSLEDVPTKISEEMLNDLENPGAYFYKETEDSKDIYALLTAGQTVRLSMSVSPTLEDSSMHFAVNFFSTTDPDSKTLYKIYKTNAKAVSADNQRLKKPYLQINSEGMNIGYLQKMSSGIGYFITPLEDFSDNTRVFVPEPGNESVEDLENGIYLYTYKLTTNGTQLLSATPRDSIQVYGQVTSFTDKDISKTATILLNDQIKMDVVVSDESAEVLHQNNFEEYYPICLFTLTHQDSPDSLVIAQASIKSYFAVSD